MLYQSERTYILKIKYHTTAIFFWNIQYLSSYKIQIAIIYSKQCELFANE